ncbi:hypothetical protein DOY81_005311 [Sarcophaga bullata]|nr:hypothetical protein DOY81_005311 [Sarcophaga bullata]
MLGYTSTWVPVYEYSKYPFMFEAGQKCQQAVYRNMEYASVSVVNTGVYIIVNKANSVEGVAKVLGPGKLAVAFGRQNPDTPNYLVLGTDYDNWSVVYSCKNVTSYGHAKLLWILTRQRQPSDDTIEAAKQVIKDNKLSETFLMKSTQTDCPDIPPPTTNNEDSQITAASFNVAEIENSNDLSSTSTQRVIESA